MRAKTDPLKALKARVCALEEREQARILGISTVLYGVTTAFINAIGGLEKAVEELDSDLVEKGLMAGASPATRAAYADFLEEPDSPEDEVKRSEQAEMGEA
jgi:hypothetical protein